MSNYPGALSGGFISHRFQSLKSDLPDLSVINPVNWNQSHIIGSGAIQSGALGGTVVGSGNIQSGAVLYGALSSGVVISGILASGAVPWKPFVVVSQSGPGDGGDYGPGTTGTITAGVMEAISALGTSGGTVLIKDGSYAISGTIKISGNRIKIKGESWQTQLKQSFDGTVLSVGLSGVTGVANCTIEDISIIPMSGVSPTSHAMIVDGTSASSFTNQSLFRHILINDGSTRAQTAGLYVGEAQDNLFDWIYINNAGHALSGFGAFHLAGRGSVGSSVNYYKACNSQGAQGYAFVLNVAWLNVFDGCIFDDNGISGTLGGILISQSNNYGNRFQNCVGATATSGTFGFNIAGGAANPTDDTEIAGFYYDAGGPNFTGRGILVNGGTNCRIIGGKIVNIISASGFGLQSNGTAATLVYGMEFQTLSGFIGPAISSGSNDLSFHFRDCPGVNPWGLVAPNKFNTSSGTIGPIGTNAVNPQSGQTYTVVGTDLLVSSSGGVGTAIVIKDSGGNTIVSGLTSLSAQFLPYGFSINFGPISTSPTTTVFAM